MTINPRGSRKSRIHAEVLGVPALCLALAQQITGALLSMLEHRIERGMYKSADEVQRLACGFVAENLAALYTLGVSPELIKIQAEILAGRVGRMVARLAERESEVRR